MMVKRSGRHGPTDRPRALLALVHLPVVQRRLINSRPPAQAGRRPFISHNCILYLQSVPYECTYRVIEKRASPPNFPSETVAPCETSSLPMPWLSLSLHAMIATAGSYTPRTTKSRGRFD